MAEVCCPPVGGTTLDEAVPAGAPTGGLDGIGSVRDVLVVTVRVGKRVRTIGLFGPGSTSFSVTTLFENVTAFLDFTSISLLPWRFLSFEGNKLAKNSSPNL